MHKLEAAFIVVFLYIFLFFVGSSNVYAFCTYASECNQNPCSCPGYTAWCDSSNTCRYTCSPNTCAVTSTGTVAGCDCQAYEAWHPCSGGYQIRYCSSYKGVCSSIIYQERACVTPTGGADPTNTPIPTIAGCSLKAPTGLSPSGLTQCMTSFPATVNLRWNAVAGATEYIVRLDDLSNGWNGCGGSTTPNPGDRCFAATSLTERNVSVRADIDYRWWVLARNSVCTSPRSEIVNFKIPRCCTINSAVMSPSNITAVVGSNISFSLTVNDTPAGCADEALFTRSNTNISIRSTNPDTAEPFTVTARCDLKGSAVLSGRARENGVARASDTSNITCQEASPTVTIPPGQCLNPDLTSSWSCSGGDLNLSYSWPAVTGATTYEWQLSSVDDFSSLLSTGNGIGFTSTQPAGTYYARARVNTSDGSCVAPSAWSPTEIVSDTSCVTPTPSAVTLSEVILNGVDDTGLGLATVPAGYTLSDPVNFTISGGSGIASLTSPDSPVGEPYQTLVTALGVGTTEYMVSAIDNFGVPVSAVNNIIVNNPQAWCQAKEGDVVAAGVADFSGGNVICNIPASCSLSPQCLMITYDSGPAPAGIVVAKGSVSSSYSHVVNDDYQGSVYNYDYFDKKTTAVTFNAPPAVVNSANLIALPTSADGYKWVKVVGQLSIDNDIDLGQNRLVLFVDGDLNINGKINVQDGKGFFMAVVNGDIIVSPAVGGAQETPIPLPDLEGLYFADRAFVTGAGDIQLHTRGSVAARDFELERNLTDNSTIPAELFEFGPDQVIQIPAVLSRKQIIWREVAP